MASARRGERRRQRARRRLALLALVIAGSLAISAVSVADEPTVEPAETASGFAWKPAAVTAQPGGTVAFRNPGAVTPHGVHWTGGPEKPSCSGVPVDSSGASWSGTCAFSQAGSYTFVCTVHPEEMKGTITIASGETAPEAPAPGSAQPPVAAPGPLVGALQLARKQRGQAVRGSITISSTAIGGRLNVELRAPRSALGGDGGETVRIGEASRSLSEAGRVAFAVRLQPLAKRALRRRGSLSLIVNVVVRPPGGPMTALTRRVKLSE